MRKFVRHPNCIPIDIAIDESHAYAIGERSADHQPDSTVSMQNISGGGLAFSLLQPVRVGSRLTISMPEIWPDYRASGTVVWCRESAAGFEAGVQFSDSDEAFKARMVAQFCQIEDYRREVHERDGRDLSSDEAAREWIIQFAAEFAETVGWQ